MANVDSINRYTCNGTLDQPSCKVGLLAKHLVRTFKYTKSFSGIIAKKHLLFAKNVISLEVKAVGKIQTQRHIRWAILNNVAAFQLEVENALLA